SLVTVTWTIVVTVCVVQSSANGAGTNRMTHGGHHYPLDVRNRGCWVSQNLLCHLTSEEEGSVAHALERQFGATPQQYYSETLKKDAAHRTLPTGRWTQDAGHRTPATGPCPQDAAHRTLPTGRCPQDAADWIVLTVALLTEEVSRSPIRSSSVRCSCDDIRAASVACVPLVTHPDAAPLVEALLKRPVSCGCFHLSEEFMEAVSTAWLRRKLVIEDMAVVALWCHSLSSLERAVLSLLDSVLSDLGSVMQTLERVIIDSLLPKASALHCHIFLLVNDVFRNVLIAVEANLAARALIKVFTGCFLQIRTAQKPQESLPLRAFFPQAPHNLLTPLLTATTEVPKQAWLKHLNWLVKLFQELLCERIEGEEVEESPRQRRAVFEAWFLLVQCGDWVDAAAELLVSVGSEEAEPLLFLLTFYHHPTNRGHQSAQQATVAREAWSHLRIIFPAHTPPSEQRSPTVNELLSSTPSTNLVLHLLLNFAVFSQASISGVGEAIQKHTFGTTGVIRYHQPPSPTSQGTLRLKAPREQINNNSQASADEDKRAA
ncbi:hypothetical protein NFI96_021428, partial [Prochilodus magdalenae]